jgi:hypothetical protein
VRYSLFFIIAKALADDKSNRFMNLFAFCSEERMVQIKRKIRVFAANVRIKMEEIQ